MLKDNYNRIISYLRVSLTDRCNLRCKYCMPEDGVVKKSHYDILPLKELALITKAAVSTGVTKIRITGGEPLVRKGILDFAEEIGSIEELNDLAMTTNGILLENFAEELHQRGVQRLNISLDTTDPNKYSEITRGGDIRKVFKGIEAARKAGFFPIKINTVLMKNINDNELLSLASMVKNGLADELRFIELMPIGETASWDRSYFLPSTIVIEKLKLEELPENDPSSPSKGYLMPGGGKIGLISPLSHKFCGSCNKIRLTADGKIKLCLLSDIELDLSEEVRKNPSGLALTIKNMIKSKPETYGKDIVKRNMAGTGG